MALNGTQMGDEIWNVIKPYLEWPDDETPPITKTGKEIWELIGQAIVAHITANGHAVGTLPEHHTDHNLDLV